MQNDFNLSETLRFLKKEARHLWGRISENNYELPRTKFAELKTQFEQSRTQARERMEKYRESRKAPVSSEPETPGVKYTVTENNPLSAGQEKVPSKGIDSFGEPDTFDPDEASDSQGLRNRKQNSDLADRYYTPGLHDDKTH